MADLNASKRNMSPYTPDEFDRISRAATSPYFRPKFTEPRSAAEERQQDELKRHRRAEQAVFDNATWGQVRLTDWPQDALEILHRAEAEAS